MGTLPFHNEMKALLLKFMKWWLSMPSFPIRVYAISDDKKRLLKHMQGFSFFSINQNRLKEI